MSTPAAKRRRTDAAFQTLSKPFRSPFKTPFKSPMKGTLARDTDSQAEDLSSAATLTLNADPPTPQTTPLASKSTNVLPKRSHTPKTSSKLSLGPTTPRTTLAGLGTSGNKQFVAPVATAQINADPEVAQLIKEQRELERELREVKEGLDGAEQAVKIERDSRCWMVKMREKEGVVLGEEEELVIDGELLELVEKWRAASRLAAEEMFGRVRDRVNRMGGPRAWKDAEKKRQENQNTWDQEETNNNNDNDDDDEDEAMEEAADIEKRDLYAEYDIDLETENEKSQRAKGLGDTGELPGQEDEFTMAMMLRTLNVDLDTIGYDRHEQRWVD